MVDFENYLQQRKLSPSTVEGYMYQHRVFMDWLEAETLDGSTFGYNDLLDYMRHLSAKGKSKQAVNGHLAIMRHYCNFLIKEGKRNDNPAAGIFIKGLTRKLPSNLLSTEEMETLFGLYRIQLQVGDNRKTMLGLMVYQGLTTDELIRLQGHDIKLHDGKIFIRGTKKTNERLLPLHAQQMTMLQGFLKANRSREGALFQEEVRGVKSVHYVRNQVKQMFKQLKMLNPRTINSLQVRNSVITGWLRKNNLRQTQYMAGHKYVGATERYLLDNLDDLQNELKNHHPMK